MSSPGIFLLLCAISLLSFVSGRAVTRDIGVGGLNPPDAAVDLNRSSFAAVLKAAPARFAVVEFFAHWCPACRNYKPQYEKVARIFNGPDAPHPGHVIMARVDCASKINAELCDGFSINHYPMLLWGYPKNFLSGHWKPDEVNTKIRLIDEGRTAERLLNWINKELGSSFSLEDKKYGNDNTLPSNALDPKEIAQAIYDVEEATAYAFDIILSHKMIKMETQSPLIKFLQLLAAHHPSKRCRRGSAEILIDFSDLWPANLQSLDSSGLHENHENDRLKSLRICGKEVPRGYWIFCHGSRKETRGFSCGLWVLLHSLSVRVGDGESHSTFIAIRDFIYNFFICEDCRKHFYAMCSEVSAPVNTSRELSLWLWSAHNRVNERLQKVEKDSGSGDPKFPKMIWPTKQICPKCYSSSFGKTSNVTSLSSSASVSNDDWNKDEVYNFLVNYYGKLLVSSSDKDELNSGASENGRLGNDPDDDGTSTATNAVAVPVGAALGIALASCAFGVLACFWRAQQKNRKYLHQLHSLKNI